jgi:hypothetical protein
MPQVFDNETIRSFLRGAFRRLGYHVPAMDVGPDAMIARAGRSLHAWSSFIVSTCSETIDVGPNCSALKPKPGRLRTNKEHAS